MHNGSNTVGGNYIWQFASFSCFDINLAKSAHLHNTKVVADGLNFNFAGNLIWQLFKIANSPKLNLRQYFQLYGNGWLQSTSRTQLQ